MISFSRHGRKLANLVCAAVLAVAGIGAAGTAEASMLSAWSLSGPGTTSVSGTNDSPTFSYNLNPAGFSEVTWTAQANVLSSGVYSFDWNYSGFHSFFNVTAFLDTTNPVQSLVSAGPANCCTSPSSGFNFSGQDSFAVTAGETIGFAFGGSNFDSNNVLRGTLTVNRVPLPAGGLLLMTAIAGVAAAVRRKRKAA